MRIAVAAAGLLLAFQALACGYCVEDKIASTYDHAVVVHALEQKHHVAFFHIDGVRVSVDTLTLSFAFDPHRSSLGAAQRAVEKKLALKKLSLMPLRVMEHAADLKMPKN